MKTFDEVQRAFREYARLVDKLSRESSKFGDAARAEQKRRHQQLLKDARTSLIDALGPEIAKWIDWEFS